MDNVFITTRKVPEGTWLSKLPRVPPFGQCLPRGLLGYEERKRAELQEAWRDRMELGALEYGQFRSAIKNALREFARKAL